MIGEKVGKRFMWFSIKASSRSNCPGFIRNTHEFVVVQRKFFNGLMIFAVLSPYPQVPCVYPNAPAFAAFRF